MNTDQPYLFIEINEKNFIFLIVKYNKDLEFKVLESLITKSEGIIEGKVFDVISASKVLKKNLINLEKKIDYTFKKATIINNQSNYNCINISGFKKIGGTQIVEDDISYILNDLKKLIMDNHKEHSLIHLFNSNFSLDNTNLKNLPIGLYGELYTHHLTFYLFLKNDLKNIKLILNNCHIEIERIILKPFAEGINKIIKNNIIHDYCEIKLKNNLTNISFFKNKSLIYSQDFLFGSDIIIKDIVKVCSLSSEIVTNIIKEISFDNLSPEEKEIHLDKKFFIDTNFRKISYGLISDIIDSRISEIILLVYKENTNLKFLRDKTKEIFFTFENEYILSSIKLNITKKYFNSMNIHFDFVNQATLVDGCLGSAILMGRGWEREAIPIIQTKKSLISRIFTAIFS